MSTVLCDVFDINRCAYNIGSFHKVAFQRSTDHPRTDTFCSCDLGLDLITLTYKPDLDILKTYLYTLILLRSIQGEGEEWSFYGDRTCVEQCCARCHRHSEDRGLSQILHDELHWLDVPDRVFFKLAVLVHRCLNGRTQPYLSDYCVLVASAVTRRHLRSANRQLFAVPRYRLNTYGRRAFSVAGPQSGTLSDFIRDPTIRAEYFRRLFETYLFVRYQCIQRVRGS